MWMSIRFFENIQSLWIIIGECLAQPSCSNLLNTKSQSEHQDHKEKNNDYLNLSLCLLLFLGVFVFEDFFMIHCNF